ncbi:MAG: hypothetical protein L0387_35080 [Acidobacteria bacterium]|nr:hypothetical protein [Acidobacteriota bacterium]
MSIRVVVVEDDFYAREAVATRLQRDSGIRLVGEYAWPDDLLADLAYGPIQPDVCWVDVDFPKCAEVSLECFERMRMKWPEMRVLGSTLAFQSEHEELWRQGLAGLVLKHECGNAIGLAVRAAAQGWRVLTSGTLALANIKSDKARVRIVQPLALPGDMPHHLSRVANLRYIRQLTPDQIAEELVLSENTVESYLKVIKRVLHLEGRERLLTRGFMVMTNTGVGPDE